METPIITENRIREYLTQGKRFDGRGLEEYRDLKIETGVSKNAEGSAVIKLGNTEVIVGVKMDVSEPYADSPNKGNLMVTAELLPLSSSRYESGPPTIESIELARVIDRMIRESKVIDFEKLCIKEGEKVWTVFVDIYSINADGNLLDAAGIGAMAALKNAKIPEVNEETGKADYGNRTNKNIPMKDYLPISITVHRMGNHLFVDPSIEEEDSSETRVTLGVADGTIYSMQKGNSGSLEIEEFENVLDLAIKVWKKISPEIKKQLK